MLGRDVSGDAVFLTDAKDTSELHLLEPHLIFDVPAIQCPCVASVQMGGEDPRSEDLDFGSYEEAVYNIIKN